VAFLKPEKRNVEFVDFSLLVIFILGILILVATATNNLKVLRYAIARSADSMQLLKKTMQIFRKKPSDVTLYMDCLYSDEWPEIQRRVEDGTTNVLNSLKLTHPHDSVREEVGLPMSGVERLVNLLVLRRVVLHFIARGQTGIQLLKKLNFQIDQKYVQLMNEAKTILKGVLDKLTSENKSTLTELELREVVSDLEGRKRINDAPAPRRVFAEIQRNDDNSITGKIRLTQAGREIKVTVERNQTSPEYHSKLSPSFTNFMSVIGLSPEESLFNQPLFAEEAEYLTSRQ
jgi:hypothetical protein